MVVFKIKIDNVYNFKNFEMNLSYPKKINNSLILNEHLKGYPNFRYKKAVVLIGSNATGKTCLGRIINNVSLYVNTLHEEYIKNMMNDNSTIEITFVNDKPLLYKLSIVVNNDILNIKLYENKISLKDSFETCEEGLKISLEDDIKLIHQKIGNLECQFTYPEMNSKVEINDKNKESFLKILKCIIGTLDPSLNDVMISKEIDNSFIIKRGNDNIIIQDGKLLNKEVLSSGTIEGIDIALFIASMKGKINKLYYCDEHFSYIHSDIEKYLLSIMIGKIRDNEQLFFTTHNIDILDMSLPKHTYAFLGRNNFNNKSFITFADEYLKRNTDSVRCAYENDIFQTYPDLSLLDELVEDDEK